MPSTCRQMETDEDTENKKVKEMGNTEGGRLFSLVQIKMNGWRYGKDGRIKILGNYCIKKEWSNVFYYIGR